MKIVLIGTAWPYRGGLAAFNERLIAAFNEEGHQGAITTFTLQYPNVFFPGKTQLSTSPAPQHGMRLEKLFKNKNRILSSSSIGRPLWLRASVLSHALFERINILS
jgi:hypothetical protein